MGDRISRHAEVHCLHTNRTIYTCIHSSKVSRQDRCMMNDNSANTVASHLLTASNVFCSTTFSDRRVWAATLCLLFRFLRCNSFSSSSMLPAALKPTVKLVHTCRCVCIQKVTVGHGVATHYAVCPQMTAGPKSEAYVGYAVAYVT